MLVKKDFVLILNAKLWCADAREEEEDMAKG